MKYRAGQSQLNNRAALLMLAAGIIAVVVARLLAQDVAAAPSGPDPGNWLRMAWRLGGDGVDTTPVTYPPLLPLALRAQLEFLEPMFALKTLGILSSVLLVAPCYLLLRERIPTWAAAALALAALAAGYQQEVYGWGGYPQLLGTAFLLFAVYWLTRWLARGERKDLILSAVFVVLTVGTSHFVVAQLAVVAVFLLAGFVWRAERRGDARRRAVTWIAVSAAASLVFLPWYVDLLTLAASTSTHATSFSWLDIGSYEFVFRESPAFGFGYAIVGAILTVAPVGGAKTRELRPVLFGLVWGPFILFALTGEVRHFQLTQIGLILSLALLISEAEASLKDLTFSTLRMQRLAWSAPAVVLSAFLLLVAFQGHERLEEATAWYRTVDGRTQAALDFIRTETPEDSAVLVGTSPHGMPYGWWVEGYARRGMLQHINADLLLFKGEREQAALTARLLSGEIQPAEASALLRSMRIEYILIAPTGPKEFAHLLGDINTTPVFNNGEYTVLRIESVLMTQEGAP